MVAKSVSYSGTYVYISCLMKDSIKRLGIKMESR